jgi:hypothetical protein
LGRWRALPQRAARCEVQKPKQPCGLQIVQQNFKLSWAQLFQNSASSRPPVTEFHNFTLSVEAVSAGPPCSAASFEVNLEPHAGARASVRLYVGLMNTASKLGPHTQTNGSRDVPRCGALSLLQKPLHYKGGRGVSRNRALLLCSGPWPSCCPVVRSEFLPRAFLKVHAAHPLLRAKLKLVCGGLAAARVSHSAAVDRFMAASPWARPGAHPGAGSKGAPSSALAHGLRQRRWQPSAQTRLRTALARVIPIGRSPPFGPRRGRGTRACAPAASRLAGCPTSWLGTPNTPPSGPSPPPRPLFA